MLHRCDDSPGATGASGFASRAGIGRRCHEELAQAQVPEGHRATGTGNRIDVDPGLRELEQLETVEQPGGGVPEGTGPGVGGEELGRRAVVGGGDPRGQARGLLVGDRGRLRRTAGRGDGDGRLAFGVERPLVAERVVVRGQRGGDAELTEPRRDVRQPGVP